MATSIRRRTRDVAVIDFCDKVLKLIAGSMPRKTCPQCQVWHDGREDTCDRCSFQKNVKPFDKTAYMRDYMRKKRAKEKS